MARFTNERANNESISRESRATNFFYQPYWQVGSFYARPDSDLAFYNLNLSKIKLTLICTINNLKWIQICPTFECQGSDQILISLSIVCLLYFQ
jgi:hypothetical protein